MGILKAKIDFKSAEKYKIKVCRKINVFATCWFLGRSSESFQVYAASDASHRKETLIPDYNERKN